MGRKLIRIIIVVLLMLVALPLSNVVSQDSGPNQPLPERVAGLEEFRRQQRDYNHGFDQHMTQHMDDVLRSQGEQNRRIDDLEVKLSDETHAVHQVYVVAGLLGVIIGSGLSLGVPLVVSALNRRSDSLSRFEEESKKQRADHEARIKRIEDVCLALGRSTCPEDDDCAGKEH